MGLEAFLWRFGQQVSYENYFISLHSDNVQRLACRIHPVSPIPLIASLIPHIASKWTNGNKNYAAWCHIHFILAPTPTLSHQHPNTAFPAATTHLPLVTRPTLASLGPKWTNGNKWQQKRCGTMPRSCYIVLDVPIHNTCTHTSLPFPKRA